MNARFLAMVVAGVIGGGGEALAQGVDPRLGEAIGWYTGTAGRVDDSRAHALLVEAVADQDPISRMWLARCHSTGRMGFARDPEKARAIAAEVIEAIRRLAAGGEVEAIFLMGTAYDEALGVGENPAEAASWYGRAAERGHVLAQHNMGNLHAAGRGVAQDDRAAVDWWRKAAAQGDVVPMLRIGERYESGKGVSRDLDQARAWYARAASRGNAQAKAALERLGG